MLTISAQSMAVFDAEAERRFVADLVLGLRRGHAARLRAVPDADLVGHVQRALQDGRRLGLGWRSSLAAYVALWVLIHPRFSDHPAVRHALFDDPFDTLDHRMKRLGSTVPDHVWDEITAAPGRVLP